MPPLNENHRLLLQMLSFRECLARVGLLSHFSKLLTTEKREATLGDTENIRPESCCLRAHPAVQLARFRDLATSNLSTITHLQVQHQLVPLFCEIRLAGAVPASSALGIPAFVPTSAESVNPAPRRGEAVPGELIQCFVHSYRRLHHRPACFSCVGFLKLLAWSVGKKAHANVFFACSRPQSRNKRSTCRVSLSCVIISAHSASDNLHVSTRFRIRISRLWCAANPKFSQSFMRNLFLTCCLYHSRPPPLLPVPRSRCRAQSAFLVRSC